MERIKRITVYFYSSPSGHEPVREWLRHLRKEDKRIIGEDIKTIEYGWPRGMPLVKKLDKGLWEVRSNLSHKEIARVLFTVVDGVMVLLHGFIKKSQKTPVYELKIAKERRDRVLKA